MYLFLHDIALLAQTWVIAKSNSTEIHTLTEDISPNISVKLHQEILPKTGQSGSVSRVLVYHSIHIGKLQRNLDISGATTWKTYLATRCKVVLDQHIPGGWNTDVVSMGRTARLHQRHLGVWMVPCNHVCPD